MTIAQKIAKLFNNDGQNWKALDGRSLDDVCTEDDAFQAQNTSGLSIKYLFTDGSSIVATMEGWDFGVQVDPNCFCWESCGCHCIREE